jgi:hypothetical protein
MWTYQTETSTTTGPHIQSPNTNTTPCFGTENILSGYCVEINRTLNSTSGQYVYNNIIIYLTIIGIIFASKINTFFS